MIRMARAAKRQATLPRGAVTSFSPAEYEALYDLPEDTKEEKKAKNVAIRAGNRDRRSYGRTMKPYLWAVRHVQLSEAYSDIDSFMEDYPAAKARRDAAAEEAARMLHRAGGKTANT